MTMEDLLAELRARGCAVETAPPAFHHLVVRRGARSVVLPADVPDAALGPLFLAQVARRLDMPS
ncbi:hypothetical protein [Aureimonas sp. AU4]|uniref:hypothetical protein n=1 Tax=Aureimonas sp. AU4 TaxID=1638163 RepID=UPI000784AB31|nr:hypothetical protein [Aureimonas sp. AU4]